MQIDDWLLTITPLSSTYAYCRHVLALLLHSAQRRASTINLSQSNLEVLSYGVASSVDLLCSDSLIDGTMKAKRGFYDMRLRAEIADTLA